LLSPTKLQPTSTFQDSAIPKLLAGDSSIVAAETGNGKTLAFLLPVIEQILQLKRQHPRFVQAVTSRLKPILVVAP